MKAIEILEKNPLSAKLVVEWFFNKMIESLNVGSVDEEFRNFMREQALDNEKIAVMIDASPRMLLDVFDENNIIIETSLYPNGEFTIKIGNQATTKSWKTRKEAELFAIDAAFDILEKQLTPKELSDETDN